LPAGVTARAGKNQNQTRNHSPRHPDKNRTALLQNPLQNPF
jgi:hypothetical protein